MSIFSKRKRLLGIDVGTSSVKAVYLESRHGDSTFTLKNYGSITTLHYIRRSEATVHEHSFKIPDIEVGDLIKDVLKIMGGPLPTQAVMSIPVHSSFITEISLPAMRIEEIGEALEYQARHYIPVPLSEVELDWQIVERDEKDSTKPIRVLLLAVPKGVIERYQALAGAAKLDLQSLEIETFSLSRALLAENPEPHIILDIGSLNSSINVVKNGIIELSHNIDTAGLSLTKTIAKTLNVNFKRAESFKREHGLEVTGGDQEAIKPLYPILDKIVTEVNRVMASYELKQQLNVKGVVLTGGTTSMNGLLEFFKERLKVSIILGDPWQHVTYPQELKTTMQELGSSFAAAVGLAMKSE